jgi:peptide/nickel transport system permease protein
MLHYVIKRVLIFIPTLLAISLIVFTISVNAPGDPVEAMLTMNTSGQGQLQHRLNTERAYAELRHKLGLDLPVFYFSLSNASLPDTLHRIPKKEHRASLERLCDRYGSWEYVSRYYIALRNYEMELLNLKPDSASSASFFKVREYASSLYTTWDPQKIQVAFSNSTFLISENKTFFTPVRVYFESAVSAFDQLLHHAEPHKKYIPSFRFNGMENQYHLWFFGDKPWFGASDGAFYRSAGFIRGDFGKSYQDKRPVSSVLWDAVRWTLLISFFSILISYLVAIPLGVHSAVKKGTAADRAITTILFILYSLPSFWIATMAIKFLCGGDYFDMFPAFGLGTLPDDAPFVERFSETAYHLILPLLCLTYGSFAFLSRQMRGGMLNVIGQDYIRTARAKGLEEKNVVWKHAFRNSLLPLITLFSNIFPLLIAGSFVIEFIFSIPGMGKLSLEALIAHNYPVVYTIVMFSAVLNLTGNLVADILYAVADPRISFSGKKE